MTALVPVSLFNPRRCRVHPKGACQGKSPGPPPESTHCVRFLVQPPPPSRPPQRGMPGEDPRTPSGIDALRAWLLCSRCPFFSTTCSIHSPSPSQVSLLEHHLQHPLQFIQHRSRCRVSMAHVWFLHGDLLRKTGIHALQWRRFHPFFHICSDKCPHLHQQLYTPAPVSTHTPIDRYTCAANSHLTF